MINRNKNAISPVIVTVLLLLAVISSFVIFQGWFQTYSGSMFNEVDANVNDPKALEINSISGDTLYTYNIRENVHVSEVKVDGINCNINQSLSKGVNSINISSCINLTTNTFFEVVLMTNKGIFTKSLHTGEIGSSTTTSPTPNPLCTDLSLLLHFDNQSSKSETNNFFYDWSANGNDGNLGGSGVIYTNSGKSGKGLEFDNTDNSGRIEMASDTIFDFDNATGMSVFLWFNKSTDCDSIDDDTETFVTRFGYGHSDNTWYISCYGPSDELVFGFRPDGTATDITLYSGQVVDDGQWHLGGWVYDENTNMLNLYLDGVLVDSSATDFYNEFSSTNPLCIGAYDVPCDRYEYSGILDEVSIWDRSLSPSEVSSLYSLETLTDCDS